MERDRFTRRDVRKKVQPSTAAVEQRFGRASGISAAAGWIDVSFIRVPAASRGAEQRQDLATARRWHGGNRPDHLRAHFLRRIQVYFVGEICRVEANIPAVVTLFPRRL